VFCVIRSTFTRIVALVKDNPLLQGKKCEKQSKHFVPEIHLLATLKLFEAEGNQGGSKQLHENLGMGKGSISSYVDHGVKVILSLSDQCFFWPLDEERLETSGWIKHHQFLTICEKVIDGTHLGLSTRPEKCGKEYFTRKGQYPISVLIILDTRYISAMQMLDGP